MSNTVLQYREQECIKNKSRLGCDFLSRARIKLMFERVVNPFRIPRDDSNAKVMLFPESAIGLLRFSKNAYSSPR